MLLAEIKAKAKIWGDSKKDLLKSIELYPSKEAYLLLAHVEEQTTYNKNKIKKWLDLANNCDEKHWKCQHCSFIQKIGVSCVKTVIVYFHFINQGYNDDNKERQRIII